VHVTELGEVVHALEDDRIAQPYARVWMDLVDLCVCVCVCPTSGVSQTRTQDLSSLSLSPSGARVRPCTAHDHTASREGGDMSRTGFSSWSMMRTLIPFLGTCSTTSAARNPSVG
jgi:hypothetical protein